MAFITVVGLLLLVFVIGVQYTSSPSRSPFRHQPKQVGLFSAQKLHWAGEAGGHQADSSNDFVHFHPRQKADSPLQSAEVNQFMQGHQHKVSLYDGNAEYDGRQVPVFRDVNRLRADMLPPIEGEEVLDDGPPYIPQRRLIHFDLKGMLHCAPARRCGAMQ